MRLQINEKIMDALELPEDSERIARLYSVANEVNNSYRRKSLTEDEADDAIGRIKSLISGIERGDEREEVQDQMALAKYVRDKRLTPTEAKRELGRRKALDEIMAKRGASQSQQKALIRRSQAAQRPRKTESQYLDELAKKATKRYATTLKIEKPPSKPEYTAQQLYDMNLSDFKRYSAAIFSEFAHALRVWQEYPKNTKFFSKGDRFVGDEHT